MNKRIHIKYVRVVAYLERRMGVKNGNQSKSIIKGRNFE